MPPHPSEAAPPADAPPRFRALIVDDRLRDERGHQLGFVSGMAGWLSRQGATVEIWAHRAFHLAGAVPGGHVRRVFAISWAEAFVRASPRTRLLAVAAHNLRFLREMLRANRGARWDLVIATEANALHLLAWRLWLGLTPRRTRLLLVFVHPPWMLDYSPVDGSARPKPQARLYRWALRALGGSLRTGRCRLAADSEAVAHFLRAGGKWAVADVVVPASEAQVARWEVPAPPRGAGLRLGILGRPVRERGFDRLLAALEQWCASEDHRAHPVRFVVQWHDDPEALPADRATLERLAGRFPEAVEVMSDSLDAAAYAALLTSLHGGIVTYNRSHYAHRASNVAMEFLCSGRPFVTTADTWMAREQAAHGAGVACGESPAEIVRAMATLARDYEALAAAAWTRRTAARERFSWPRFFAQTGIQFSPTAPAA